MAKRLKINEEELETLRRDGTITVRVTETPDMYRLFYTPHDKENPLPNMEGSDFCTVGSSTTGGLFVQRGRVTSITTPEGNERIYVRQIFYQSGVYLFVVDLVSREEPDELEETFVS